MKRNIAIRGIEEPADIGACHAVMMELRPHMKDTETGVASPTEWLGIAHT